VNGLYSLMLSAAHCNGRTVIKVIINHIVKKEWLAVTH